MLCMFPYFTFSLASCCCSRYNQRVPIWILEGIEEEIISMMALFWCLNSGFKTKLGTFLCFITSVVVENYAFCFNVIKDVMFIYDCAAKFTFVAFVYDFVLFCLQGCFLQCWTWLLMLSSQPMLPVGKMVGKCTANLLNTYLDSRQGTLSAAFVIKGAGFHIVRVSFLFCSFIKIFFQSL